MDCRRLIALCLIIAYLILPMDGFAQFQPFAPPSVGQEDTIAVNIEATQGHCPDCPCNDEGHGAGGCDASCFCCSCFAPLPHGFTLDFTPLITSITPFEPFRALPQICLPIFVPPQNHV